MLNQDEITKEFIKEDLPDIRPGDTIKVHQKIKETIKKGKKKEEKERIQVFEGLVIARKHGKGINSTITVRKIISGVGVEKIFPLHSPTIEKIEIISRGRTRRAKLYYLRKRVGKKARLRRTEVKKEKPEIKKEIKEEKPKEEPKEQEK